MKWRKEKVGERGNSTGWFGRGGVWIANVVVWERVRSSDEDVAPAEMAF